MQCDVVGVVLHHEMLAAVDARPIHGRKGAGARAAGEDLEGAAQRRHIALEKADVQRATERSGPGDAELVELSGARKVDVKRAFGTLRIGAGNSGCGSSE